MLKRAHNEFPSDVFLCFELAEAVITIGQEKIWGSNVFARKFPAIYIMHSHTKVWTVLTVNVGNAKGTSTVSASHLLATNLDNPKQIVLKAAFPPRSADVLFRTYKIMPRSQVRVTTITNEISCNDHWPKISRLLVRRTHMPWSTLASVRKSIVLKLASGWFERSPSSSGTLALVLSTPPRHRTSWSTRISRIQKFSEVQCRNSTAISSCRIFEFFGSRCP